MFAFLACGATSGDEGTTAAAGDSAATATEATSTTDSTASTDTGTTAAQTTAQEKESMSQYENKVAELHTTAGEIDIRFFPDVAPNHVKNFLDLAQQGFYNGTKFHRVIPGFMIQGGDPNTKGGDPMMWGTGGSGKNVNAEFNHVKHKRGIVSMARSSSPNSASSQFFICVKPTPFLDGQYSVFGQVLEGMDVVDKIVAVPRDARDNPLDKVVMEKVTIEKRKI